MFSLIPSRSASLEHFAAFNSGITSTDMLFPIVRVGALTAAVYSLADAAAPTFTYGPRSNYQKAPVSRSDPLLFSGLTRHCRL